MMTILYDEIGLTAAVHRDCSLERGYYCRDLLNAVKPLFALGAVEMLSCAGAAAAVVVLCDSIHGGVIRCRKRQDGTNTYSNLPTHFMLINYWSSSIY